MTLDGIRRASRGLAARQAAGAGALPRRTQHGAVRGLVADLAEPWFRHWNIEYLLPAIRCPLLVLQGCDDQYGSAAQVERIVEQVGGRSEAAFIEDCGHVPHREALPQTLTLMSRFIAAQT